MLEQYHQPLLPKEKFILRMARSFLIAALLLIATILSGTIASHFIVKLSWIDSFLNAVMIMTGLGTVGSIDTTLSKVFTAVYSLFSAFIFFVILAIIATPLLHRLSHRLHLDGNN
ncbi:MAG: hypothetical protein WC578_06275 [Candidatus Omnitrophota bacterium]|jgi:predicted neutral ceramidase superfamily lipid hydrolase